MRKTLKITLQIEHREMSFSTIRGRNASLDPAFCPPIDARRTRWLASAGLPNCSGPEILSLAAAPAEPGFTLE